MRRRGRHGPARHAASDRAKSGSIGYRVPVALPTPSSGDRADRKQIELLRAIGPAGRFARARSLSASVIRLARQAIRTRYPELSERDVLLKFAELHYGTALAERVRAYLMQRDP